MEFTDKKKDIILALQLTDDEQLIEQVYELLHPDAAIENIEIAKLPAEVESKINRGLDDYHNGRYTGHDQMKQKMQEWLLK